MNKNGWPLLPLGEAVSYRKEFIEIDDTASYKRCRVQLHAQGVVLRDEIDGGMIKTKRQQVCRTDEFLVAEIDAKMGGFGLVPSELEGAIVSSHYFLFAPKLDRLVPSFLGYFCRTPAFREQVTSRGTTNYAAIRPSHVLEYIMPLPPLDEQNRIVAKIKQLAERIEEARRLGKQSRVELDSLVGILVKQGFTEWPNEEWDRGCLGDFVLDDCYGTSEKTHSTPVGIPILRMGNIQNGDLDTRDLKYLHIKEQDRGKWILRKGDILVNRTNSAELVGKCAVFELEEDWGFASYLIRLRLDLERAEPRLVARYINSPIGREYMFRERKQMTGQANVNSTKLKALPIALPSLKEQRRLVAYLDGLQAKMHELKRVHGKTAAELDALLPSILDKAFKGEL